MNIREPEFCAEYTYLKDEQMNVLNSQFPLGAEVQGLDLRKPLSGQEVGGLRRVIHERAVVVVRGQQLQPYGQVRSLLEIRERDAFGLLRHTRDGR